MSEKITLLKERMKEFDVVCQLDLLKEGDKWGESLTHDGFLNKEVRNDRFLSLTSTLLESFYELRRFLIDQPVSLPFPSDIRNCLARFYERTFGIDYLLDHPVPHYVCLDKPLDQPIDGIVEEFDTNLVLIWLEIMNLLNSVKFWLSPDVQKKYIDAIETILNPQNSRKFKREIVYFKWRCEELKIQPILINSKWGRSYKSEGLLPLCWAEILHALENRIMAGVCPYCWAVFEIKPRGPHQMKCGKVSCNTAHNKAKYGAGYEAERKARRIPGRKQGRPKRRV